MRQVHLSVHPNSLEKKNFNGLDFSVAPQLKPKENTYLKVE